MADANILKPFVLAWEGGYVFQSTPLREGRRQLDSNQQTTPHVSIHAPT
jgi:hypothetical protein